MSCSVQHELFQSINSDVNYQLRPLIIEYLSTTICDIQMNIYFKPRSICQGSSYGPRVNFFGLDLSLVLVQACHAILLLTLILLEDGSTHKEKDLTDKGFIVEEVRPAWVASEDKCCQRLIKGQSCVIRFTLLGY